MPVQVGLGSEGQPSALLRKVWAAGQWEMSPSSCCNLKASPCPRHRDDSQRSQQQPCKQPKAEASPGFSGSFAYYWTLRGCKRRQSFVLLGRKKSEFHKWEEELASRSLFPCGEQAAAACSGLQRVGRCGAASARLGSDVLGPAVNSAPRVERAEMGEMSQHEVALCEVAVLGACPIKAAQPH